MTAIVLKDGERAADGRITRGDTITSEYTKKITRLKSGVLVAQTGAVAQSRAFVKWLEENGLDGDLSTAPSLVYDHNDEHSWAMVVAAYKKNGVTIVREYWSSGVVDYIDVKRAAWGSGSNFALGAMVAGATATQAVDVAKQLDCGTGGQTQSEWLQEIDESASSPNPPFAWLWGLAK